MDTTFKNQLTQKEINQGLATFMVKRRWHVAPIVIVMMLVLRLATGESIGSAVVAALLGAAAAVTLVVVLLRRQFSPDKVATYRLQDQAVEITGDSGVTQRYARSEIDVIPSGDVLVLCLSKDGVAIVAKRNLTAEQAAFLTGHPQ